MRVSWKHWCLLQKFYEDDVFHCVTHVCSFCSSSRASSVGGVIYCFPVLTTSQSTRFFQQKQTPGHTLGRAAARMKLPHTRRESLLKTTLTPCWPESCSQTTFPVSEEGDPGSNLLLSSNSYPGSSCGSSLALPGLVGSGGEHQQS